MDAAATTSRNVLCAHLARARPPAARSAPATTSIELRWFAPDELPGADELAFETYVQILSLWRARHEHA